MLQARGRLLAISLTVYLFLGGTQVSLCSPLDELVDQLRSGSRSTEVSERDLEQAPNAIKDNMRRLFPEVIYNPEHGNVEKLDKHYSPHLRDIGDGIQRSAHIHVRSQAGEVSGVNEDACPNSKAWAHPEHETTACCGVDTSRYAALREDHSFKACCVRRGEAQLAEEEIACRHPDGTGWAGLFEFYFPTQALEWGRTDGSSMIVDQKTVDRCIKEVAPLVKSRNTIQPDDVTLRVNLASMEQKHREELAKDFCMHPMQFMKLMDPDPIEDPYQKSPDGQGTAGEKMLEAIPVWSTFSTLGATLLADPVESSKLMNFDSMAYLEVGGAMGKATDFALGHDRGFRDDEQYCKALMGQNLNESSDGLREAVDVFGRGLSSESKNANIGYSCKEAGGILVPMSPVRKGGAEQSPDESALRALAFSIAAGVYAPAMADQEQRASYYKRFEPLGYFKFKGKPFVGSFGPNEQGVQCRVVHGESYYKGAPQADRWYTSAQGTSGSHVAPMRIFASCPKGWERWRGPHSELACGEEKLW